MPRDWPEGGRDALLSQAAARFGTPAYIYFADQIADRLGGLDHSFGRWFDISFAVKANPNPVLLHWLRGRIAMLDISSVGEFDLALAAGWGPDAISFTGPAKRDVELRRVIRAGLGELVVESLREARLADRIARDLGRIQPILIRLSPDRVPKGFGDHMAGRPSPFGIDIEEADAAIAQIKAMDALQIKGFHIYSGTQSLKPDAICDNWRGFMQIFARMVSDHDLRPERLIFGSGLGIPYHAGDAALDLAAIAAEMAGEFDAFVALNALQDCRLALELGRYLVGPAGYFVTQVVSTKQSRGSKIAICDGGLNANLAASGNFGMVIRRNYLMHKLGQSDDMALEKVDVTGPLCTSIDKLGSAVMLPQLHEGDLLAVHGCGAYGPSASPLHFISHPHPREIWIEGAEMRDVSRI